MEIELSESNLRIIERALTEAGKREMNIDSAWVFWGLLEDIKDKVEEAKQCTQ